MKTQEEELIPRIYFKRFSSCKQVSTAVVTSNKTALQLNQNNVNITFKNYLNSVNILINSHAPLKKLNKKQRKFQQKPWITKGIQNYIKNKNRLFKKYIKCGDCNKNILHQE